MGLVRKENWETILAEEITKAQTTEFEYVVNDCTSWSAKVLRAYTDLQWQPDWTNEKEAKARQLAVPMENQVFDVLQVERNHNIFHTQRGDLVQKGLGMRASLGICVGSRVAFLKKRGLCFIDLGKCTYSWRI